MVLKIKSEENIEAAKSLISNGYYSSSIHCSYYSCIQRIKHILIHKFGISDKEIYAQQQESDERSSHTYLINFIVKKIKEKQTNISDFRDTSNNLTSLKTTRNDSDYKEIQIGQGMSNTALDKAKEVLLVLEYTNF